MVRRLASALLAYSLWRKLWKCSEKSRATSGPCSRSDCTSSSASRAFAVLAFAHLPEARQVLVGRPIAKQRVAPGLGQRAARLAHLLRALLVDVRVPGADQVLGVLVQLIEVVRRVIQIAVRALGPVESDPAHRVQNRID